MSISWEGDEITEEEKMTDEERMKKWEVKVKIHCALALKERWSLYWQRQRIMSPQGLKQCSLAEPGSECQEF